MSEPLLQVKDLKIYYPVRAKNALGGSVSYLHAVDDVSFDVYKGETFGIVGESGCGKSTTGRGIVGLLEPTAGTILFEGKDIKGCSRREMARHIQIIFQDPYSSLDPRMTVGRCIEEPLDVHKVGIKSERWSKVLELMQEVGLREDGITWVFLIFCWAATRMQLLLINAAMHFPIPLKQMISVLLLTGAGAPTCVLGAKRMLQLC